MSEHIETAGRARRGGDFPAEWGTPAGTQVSAKRAAWVAENVARWQADPKRRASSTRTERRMLLHRIKQARAAAPGSAHLAQLQAELEGLLDKLGD